MAILAQCPTCRNKQSARNKVCKCGENMDKAKRGQRIKYWIVYRLPGGKQRKEFVGNSIQDAKAADGKRKAQKKEKQFFDMLPESKMTFKELSEWYLGLSKTKELKDYNGVRSRMTSFMKVFGDKTISSIKPASIENYQVERRSQGLKNTTIDQDLCAVKTMIEKAFDNDMLGGKTLKVFRRVKKIAAKAERSRKRTLTLEEYSGLLDEAAPHLRGMLIVAFNTGMRPGKELKGLRWSFIDRQSMFIRLPAEVTKEKAPKHIPINHHVKTVLDNLPRALNHDFVFTYKGNPIRLRGGPPDAFKMACKRAGIPYGIKAEGGIVMKDLRRTFKTAMVKAGVDKVYRDTIVGHSLQGMDVHYIVPSENDLRNAMDKFTEWFDREAASVAQSVTQKTGTG